MVVGLIITIGYQLAWVGAVTVTEKFTFQEPPKYKQRRCTLRRWRQTVPDARTGDTECTVAFVSLSPPSGCPVWPRPRIAPFCVTLRLPPAAAGQQGMTEQYHGDTSTASLNSMHSGTDNQCSSISQGIMCSYFYTSYLLTAQFH